jgi:hypothetical protein
LLPLVSPVTTIGDDAPVFVNVAPEEESVTTTKYDVIGPPPTLEGAVKATETCALLAVATPIVGAFGVFSGKKESVRIAA